MKQSSPILLEHNKKAIDKMTLNQSCENMLVLKDEVISQIIHLAQNPYNTVPNPTKTLLSSQSDKKQISKLAQEFLTDILLYAEAYMQHGCRTILKVGDAFKALEYFAKVYSRKPVLFIQTMDQQGVVSDSDCSIYDDDVSEDNLDENTDMNYQSDDEDVRASRDEKRSVGVGTDDEDFSMHVEDKYEQFSSREYEKMPDECDNENGDDCNGNDYDWTHFDEFDTCYGKELEIFDAIFPSIISLKRNRFCSLTDDYFAELLRERDEFERFMTVPKPTVRFLKAAFYAFVVKSFRDFTIQNLLSNTSYHETSSIKHIYSRKRSYHEITPDKPSHVLFLSRT